MTKLNYNLKLDIPQDADSVRYFIPEGYTARIEDGVLIIEPEESDDERIRQKLLKCCDSPTFEIQTGIKNGVLKSWLEKQKEQKPAEWSEEDEKIYKTIYNHFHSFNQWACSNGVTQNDVIRFLNSLKNRGNSPKSNSNSPSWKPGEEQMRQLGYVAEQNKHNMLGKELMTLYDDLKKLM